MNHTAIIIILGLQKCMFRVPFKNRTRISEFEKQCALEAKWRPAQAQKRLAVALALVARSLLARTPRRPREEQQVVQQHEVHVAYLRPKSVLR